MTTTDTTTDTLRPLAVQAAEFMGWTRIKPGFFIHTSRTGIPPNRADRMPIPRPDVDPGDALRFLEYVGNLPRVDHILIKKHAGFWEVLVCVNLSKRQEVFQGTGLLPIAGTGGCIAALTALRATTTEAGTE